MMTQRAAGNERLCPSRAGNPTRDIMVFNFLQWPWRATPGQRVSVLEGGEYDGALDTVAQAGPAGA